MYWLSIDLQRSWDKMGTLPMARNSINCLGVRESSVIACLPIAFLAFSLLFFNSTCTGPYPLLSIVLIALRKNFRVLFLEMNSNKDFPIVSILI